MMRRSIGQPRFLTGVFVVFALLATATTPLLRPIQAVSQQAKVKKETKALPIVQPPIEMKKLEEAKKVEEMKKDDQKKAKMQTPKSDQPNSVPAETGLPGEVEISFLNGSTVRMVIQSDKLDVDTPYGKLAVPVRHLRAIEFGLHFPDGAAAKIAEALKNLSSNNYKEREAASNTLVDLGPYSYAAVFEATQAPDLEISTRAKDIVKKLQTKHNKKDLKTSTDDKVVTPTFTIVGRILTPTVKVKTEYFGEAELSLAKMRTLRAIGGPNLTVEVTVDAGKYASPGQWMETEFQVDGRSAIEIIATGLVDLLPQQGGNQVSGPNGWQAQNQFGGIGVKKAGGGIVPGQKIGVVNNNLHGGMLLGKIGRTGDPFFIGDHFDDVLPTEGTLFLHIGPSPWNQQATGSYEVKIKRKN